jgi:hypothetical protein
MGGVALLYPEPDKGGRGHKGSDAQRAAESAAVSATRVKQARTVLAHSRALAEAVRIRTYFLRSSAHVAITTVI